MRVPPRLDASRARRVTKAARLTSKRAQVQSHSVEHSVLGGVAFVLAEAGLLAEDGPQVVAQLNGHELVARHLHNGLHPLQSLGPERHLWETQESTR